MTAYPLDGSLWLESRGNALSFAGVKQYRLDVHGHHQLSWYDTLDVRGLTVGAEQQEVTIPPEIIALQQWTPPTAAGWGRLPIDQIV
jgi:hypothetical protein